MAMHRKVGMKGRGMPGTRHSAKNRGIASYKGIGTPKPQVTKARSRKGMNNPKIISAMRK